MKITIPNEILMAEVERLLSKGCEVTLRAKGRSMMPYINEDTDLLIIKPVTGTICKGDIVLARTSTGNHVVHRVIKVNDKGLVLMGDGNLYGTEFAHHDDVLGLLTYIEREGKRIDCNTPRQRFKSTLLSLIWRTPRRIKHRLSKLIKSRSQKS